MFKKLEEASAKKYSLLILTGVAFLESIIFPIPVDVFTFSLASFQPKKWIRIGAIATLFSVLGALVGYFVGKYFFDRFGMMLIHLYGYEQFFERVHALFQKNVFWVMFTSAFTPIPYKVFTLSAGALNVQLFPFLTASFLGRGLRFFVETYLAQKYGKIIAMHIMKRINLYLILALITALLYIILF